MIEGITDNCSTAGPPSGSLGRQFDGLVHPLASPSIASGTRTTSYDATAMCGTDWDMTRTAAFFDLDRTLLAGASGPVFAEAFAQLGVPTPHIPGQDLLFRFFDLVGESYLVMQLAKRASSRAKGLRRDDVARVAEWAADVLLPKVQPYAPALLRSHRESGDLLVLATTSPYDLVAPLAKRLGFDAVVATRYEALEGAYTGDLDGGFVWGPGKLAAVTAWAHENDVDLDASAAYSDSVFDAPLLGAVGRPTAVNPDYRLRALALVRRWPVRSLDTPDGVPSVNGIEPFDLFRQFTRPEFFPGVRFAFGGVEHLPRNGPAIIATNHRSYFDPLVISLAIAKAGRNARFLGKKEVFDAPVVGQLARAMGGIRVDRGTGSDAPIRAAAERLEAGECVVILPQGTIPRGEEFFEPILRGRTGVARLAALFPDIPVIPGGVWGTEQVWPRSAKVPNLWQVTDPRHVSVTFGPAVTGLSRTASSEASIRDDTERVMAAIMATLPPEAHVPRKASAEELAKTTPDGRMPSASKGPRTTRAGRGRAKPQSIVVKDVKKAGRGETDLHSIAGKDRPKAKRTPAKRKVVTRARAKAPLEATSTVPQPVKQPAQHPDKSVKKARNSSASPIATPVAAITLPAPASASPTTTNYASAALLAADETKPKRAEKSPKKSKQKKEPARSESVVHDGARRTAPTRRLGGTLAERA